MFSYFVGEKMQVVCSHSLQAWSILANNSSNDNTKHNKITVRSFQIQENMLLLEI